MLFRTNIPIFLLIWTYCASAASHTFWIFSLSKIWKNLSFTMSSWHSFSALRSCKVHPLSKSIQSLIPWCEYTTVLNSSAAVFCRIIFHSIRPPAVEWSKSFRCAWSPFFKISWKSFCTSSESFPASWKSAAASTSFWISSIGQMLFAYDVTLSVCSWKLWVRPVSKSTCAR